MQNPIYCSTATLGQAAGGEWYDLEAALELIPQVECDGFEVTLHPEWNSGLLLNGTKIPGYKYHQIHELLQPYHGKVKAIHAQKDICAFLDRIDRANQTQGLVLLEEAYDLAMEIQAEYIVFHSWYFDALPSFQRITPLLAGFKEVGIPLSIETLPSPGNRRFCQQVVDFLPTSWGLTLDLYHTHDAEVFQHWLEYVQRCNNVHIQCFIDEDGAGGVQLTRDKRGLIDIFDRVRQILQKGYRGPLTLEPNGRYSLEMLNQALALVREMVEESNL